MKERKLFSSAKRCSLLILLVFATQVLRADDMITREFNLTYLDASLIIRVLNVAVKNPTGNRILGGTGKHLVVTCTQDELFEITDILPIIDQPSAETNSNKLVLISLARASQYLSKKKRAYVEALKSNSDSGASAATAPSIEHGVNTFDLYKTTFSIYAEEDAKLVKKRRIIDEEVKLPSISDLTLKGIFKTATGAPMALLSYGGINYTVRNGLLFERNRTPIKDVKAEILKDKVILTGPDRLPREFKFKSTI